MRPYDFYRNWYRDKVERDVKNTEFIHTQSDSLVAWIIGFSVTGLLLIASNFDKLEQRSASKTLLTLLFATILIGLVYRYISYLITVYQKSVFEYFVLALSEENPMPIHKETDLESMTFDELIIALKVDFEEELKYTHPIPEALKLQEEPRLRNHYRLLTKFAKTDFDLAVDFLAQLDEDAYKIPKQKTIDVLNGQSKPNEKRVGYNLKNWSITRSVLYLACIISFLATVCVLFFSLLLA